MIMGYAADNAMIVATTMFSERLSLKFDDFYRILTQLTHTWTPTFCQAFSR